MELKKLFANDMNKKAWLQIDGCLLGGQSNLAKQLRITAIAGLTSYAKNIFSDMDIQVVTFDIDSRSPV